MLTLLVGEAALPDGVKAIALTDASLPATKFQSKSGTPIESENSPLNVVPLVTIPSRMNGGPGGVESG